jgi:TubC N-terminal docking domain
LSAATTAATAARAAARALLSELTERGFSLCSAADGTLRCSPKSKLTREDAARIKESKSELLALLTDTEYLSPPPSPPSPTPTTGDNYGESPGDDTGDDTLETTVPRFGRVAEERAKTREYRKLVDEGMAPRFAHEAVYGVMSKPRS